MRRGEGKENRERLCKLAISDPKKAAAELKALADALAECEKREDIIFGLGEIFCVSKATVYRDITK